MPLSNIILYILQSHNDLLLKGTVKVKFKGIKIIRYILKNYFFCPQGASLSIFREFHLKETPSGKKVVVKSTS